MVPKRRTYPRINRQANRVTVQSHIPRICEYHVRHVICFDSRGDTVLYRAISCTNKRRYCVADEVSTTSSAVNGVVPEIAMCYRDTAVVLVL